MPLLAELRDLAAQFEGDRQGAVRIRPSTWAKRLDGLDLPADVTGILTDDEFTTPWAGGTPGDRAVDRDDLAKAVHRMTDSGRREDLLAAFLLVQAWGAGPRSRTPRHTRTAFRHQGQLISSLTATFEALTRSDDLSVLATAYASWSCPGVGRSFFTKWFSFAGHKDGRSWQPLILDALVLTTLRRSLSLTPQQLGATNEWSARYRGYVEMVHGWADELDLPADRVEWILFEQERRRRSAGRRVKNGQSP